MKDEIIIMEPNKEDAKEMASLDIEKFRKRLSQKEVKQTRCTTLSEEERAEVAVMYSMQMTPEEIAIYFGISKQTVFNILNEEATKKYQEQRSLALAGAAMEAIKHHNGDFMEVMELYIEASRDPAKIEAASLQQLWNVMKSWTDLIVKMEDLKLRVEESERRREQEQTARENEGMLQELIKAVRGETDD